MDHLDKWHERFELCEADGKICYRDKKPPKADLAKSLADALSNTLECILCETWSKADIDLARAALANYRKGAE